MNNLFRLTHYITHYITARYTLGYNVHSPYLYDFTRNVIYEENAYYCYSRIEELRHQLLNDQQKIFVDDYGTQASSERIISHIANNTLASAKEAQLLFRIANYTQATNILELGTSLGISTAYLAAYSNKCKVTTLEGSNKLIELAKNTWKKLGIQNRITTIQGNINNTLPLYLKTADKLDIIYFDANHTQEATINYFNLCLPHHHNNSIFIFDDIYYSPQMYKAWQTIQQNDEITATIDLYKMGIAFFNPHFIKKNYRMRF